MALVFIGMPVFNGERFIAQALESLHRQSFTDWTLLISDNDSTDGTAQICKSFCEKDGRIRYVKQSRNMGMTYNFKFLIDSAREEYFMWAGSHDLWTADYISRLVNVLQENPRTALAYTETSWIDEDGENCNVSPFHLDTRGMAVMDRVSIVIKTLHACDLFHGLYRTSVLKKCRFGVKSLGPDIVILMELSLFGEIAEIPGKGFIRRVFRREQLINPSERTRIETTLLKIDPSYAKRKNVRAYWEWGWQHILGIWAAPISIFMKPLLMVTAAKTFCSRFKTELNNDIFHPVFPKTAVKEK
jgi:glycosyltransferase involved in cell wall biosynthesis